jgi:uncharacterized membrane protein
MEGLFKLLADSVSLGCELIAVLMLAYGAIELVVVLILGAASRDRLVKRRAWLALASWLLLALELTLAADIVHTAIAPTWNDIGQLAAIALIRTFLNLFLVHDRAALARQETAVEAGLRNPPDGAVPAGR